MNQQWREGPTVVQLVQAKRVPGCSAMFLKARMDTELSGGAVVFEPSRSWLEDTGLHMEESVLTTDAQGYVHVLVQNPTANAKRISAGAVVGKAEEFNGCVESGKLLCLGSDVKLVGGIGLPGGMADGCEEVEDTSVCRW